MSGGSKNTTTQTTNSAPWSASQPYLQNTMSQAQNLVNSGTGAQVYTDSTVVPWSQSTMTGKNAMEGGALANLNGNGLSGQAQGIIDSGGFTTDQSGVMDRLRQTATGSFNINEDPGFQQVLDQTKQGVNEMASTAGRYGGGAHQGVIVDRIGDLGARQYQNWQSRRDAADQNLFSMGQQGQSNLGSAYGLLQQPAETMMKTGAMDEDLATRQMNDRLRIFNEQQNKPWEQLSRANAIYSGIGGMGGTTTQAQPSNNPWLQGLGYAATGAGLLGGFL
jgi:hypothetical protein